MSVKFIRSVVFVLRRLRDQGDYQEQTKSEKCFGIGIQEILPRGSD